MLDDGPGVIALVPIRPKRENFLDGDDKNAKLCVIIEILFCIPRLTTSKPMATRGKPRFFMRANQKRPTGALQPFRELSLRQPAPLAESCRLRYLEKNENAFSFQVVGHFS